MRPGTAAAATVGHGADPETHRNVLNFFISISFRVFAIVQFRFLAVPTGEAYRSPTEPSSHTETRSYGYGDRITRRIYGVSHFQGPERPRIEVFPSMRQLQGSLRSALRRVHDASSQASSIAERTSRAGCRGGPQGHC